MKKKIFDSMQHLYGFVFQGGEGVGEELLVTFSTDDPLGSQVCLFVLDLCIVMLLGDSLHEERFIPCHFFSRLSLLGLGKVWCGVITQQTGENTL